MPSKPVNTTKQVQENPLGTLISAMGETEPGGHILDMEAAGQTQLVNSTAIPTDGSSSTKNMLRLEELGFKLGEVHEDDPIFRDCELPEGWTREGSDHSMHSFICDERGFRRIGIFYKAAYYDRSAHMHIEANPETKAQADSYDAFAAWCEPLEEWGSYHSRKDGDNLVRIAARYKMSEAGGKEFDHDAGTWSYTGEMRERVIAPDGSMISEREFTSDDVPSELGR